MARTATDTFEGSSMQLEFIIGQDRSRLRSGAGGLIPAKGETVTIPRSTLQLPSFLRTASALFAVVGDPRSTISSSKSCDWFS